MSLRPDRLIDDNGRVSCKVAFLEDDDGSQTMLDGERITIGRDESNDLCLRHDMRASRRHADIVDRGGQWVIEDLGSKNGTVVNGRRVKAHPLKDRDVIEIASTRLTYQAGLDPLSTEIASLAGGELPGIELSSREREILACVSSGLSDKEISAALSISINTVRSHLERMREKTGLRNRSELTRLAVELGLEKLT
jgi:DNA-binding CsgD family transcriptional regulator